MSEAPNNGIRRRRHLAAACGLAAALLQSACVSEQRRLAELALAEVDTAAERVRAVGELHREVQTRFAERRARLPTCPAEAPNAEGMELYNCGWYTEELREIEELVQSHAESYDTEKLDELLTSLRRSIRRAPVEHLRSLLADHPNGADGHWLRYFHYARTRDRNAPVMKWFRERWSAWMGPFWPSSSMEQEKAWLERKQREFDQAENNLRRTHAALQ